MMSPCCLCVCKSSIWTFECLNQFSWNLVYILWKLSVPQTFLPSICLPVCVSSLILPANRSVKTLSRHQIYKQQYWKSKLLYDWRSVSMSWCRAHSGTCDLILFPVWKWLKFTVLFLWGALSDERASLQFAVQHNSRRIVGCIVFCMVLVVLKGSRRFFPELLVFNWPASWTMTVDECIKELSVVKKKLSP
jgi:hypothetical protein